MDHDKWCCLVPKISIISCVPGINKICGMYTSHSVVLASSLDRYPITITLNLSFPTKLGYSTMHESIATTQYHLKFSVFIDTNQFNKAFNIFHPLTSFITNSRSRFASSIYKIGREMLVP